MELTLPQVPKQNWKKGVFTCECGETVQRMGNTHKRCSKCAKEHLSKVHERKLNKHFPEIHESWIWIANHILHDKTARYFDEQVENRKFLAPGLATLAKDLIGTKSPCDSCRFRVPCSKGLACRSFYEWAESPLKYPKWGIRNNPTREWYEKTYPKARKSRCPD